MPAQLPLAGVVDATQKAQHLGRGRGRLVPARGSIQRTSPSFAFDHSQAMTIPTPLIVLGVGCGLGVGVGEQQAVGDGVPARHRQVLLAQRVFPAEGIQDRPDEVVLGLALVGLGVLGEGVGDFDEPCPQGPGVDGLVGRLRLDGFAEVVSAEERTRAEQCRIRQVEPPSPHL